MRASRTNALPTLMFAIIAGVGATRLDSPWNVVLGILAGLMLVIGAYLLLRPSR